MGTFVQIKLISPKLNKKQLKNICNDVFKYGIDLEQKLTIFNKNSEVNILNFKKKKYVSDELFEIIKKSLDINILTKGRFDITVAPILKKNGFYKNMDLEILNNISDSLNNIGIENIILNNKNNIVILNNNIFLDLSGIAKGYIVDKMSEFLKQKQINNFLINAGGDIYCTKKNNNKKWNIGIKDPRSNEIQITLNISNLAIATSGDYENVVVKEKTNKEISHIVDPILKESKEKKYMSVSVISSNCKKADAFATAIMNMKKQEALDLAETTKDIEIIVIEYKKSKKEIFYSKRIKKFLKER